MEKDQENINASLKNRSIIMSFKTLERNIVAEIFSEIKLEEIEKDKSSLLEAIIESTMRLRNEMEVLEEKVDLLQG